METGINVVVVEQYCNITKLFYMLGHFPCLRCVAKLSIKQGIVSIRNMMTKTVVVVKVVCQITILTIVQLIGLNLQH